MEKVKIHAICPICGESHFVEIDKNKEELAFKVRAREILAQDAFPELSVADRELLITGIDNECWNKIFNEEE